MRNISHGVLDFDDLPTGGSVTGIYGQNGSGKTTVIDAIGILRALLSGNMLPDTAGDVVSASAGSATVTATFLIGDKQKPSYLEYRVSMRKANPDSTRARVVAESVRIGDDPSRLGREVLGHRMEDSEADGFVSTPVYVWRSIEAVSSVKTVVSRTADRAYMEGRSFLFSRCATLDDRPDAEFLIDWAVARVRETNGVSSRSLTYINERFGEFVRLRETLCGYATNDIFVSTTRRGSYAAFAIIPIMEENPEGRNTEFPFDLLQPNPLTPGQAKRLGQTVESFDRILPTIVPGLHVLLKTGTAPSGKDGEDRVTAELFSRRGDVMVPFRCESEGIIRITALLGYLKHAYNDENALSCTIHLAFYFAREYYTIVRELPAGKGFADICLIPRKLHAEKPAAVIELKWDKSAEGALAQIREKRYGEALKEYHGNLLLAGISYDKGTKKHACVIERMEKA